MPTIELSAGTIDYVDTGGDGPVVVPVHGLIQDATLWTDVVADLRADHRCLVPTLPLGAHRTPMASDADLSIVGQARLLAELIDRLDLQDVTLVANDWGGPLISAVERPELIDRLVLTPCEAFDNLPPGLPGRFAALAGRVPGGIFVAAQALRLPPTAGDAHGPGPDGHGPHPTRPGRRLGRAAPHAAGRAPRPDPLHPHHGQRQPRRDRRRPGAARHARAGGVDHRRPRHAGRARPSSGRPGAGRALRRDPRQPHPGSPRSADRAGRAGPRLRAGHTRGRGRRGLQAPGPRPSGEATER